MERIFVTVRARPLCAEDSKFSPWRISGNSIHLANQSAKFEFDRVFGEECKTRDVYETRTKEIVASAVRGFNGTVFAYGQTNSGKTHTMRGSETEPGIIPMAINDLFHSMQENVDREFLVRIAYMEIYNEEINDLLSPDHRRLQIHESLERGIFVAGLKEEIVSSPEQVLDLMKKGEALRHIGETNMNLHSSRSHTIFRVTIESREKTDDNYGDQFCDAVRVSVLNLVDLAGSERAAKTGAEGVRLKEGSHINKSLMTLGTVIKKLSEGADIQGGHVPYRDSKLTRILQPALGGNANTAIICNITLAQDHTEETKSSLQFASRALRVTNCACVNEILTNAALLKRQRKEIEELRARLLASHSEHWEQEILNLRNTLLQSELEKERIALELEDEKKAKAQLEKRLLEQMSMVLEMKKENKSINGEKAGGRVNTDSLLPFEDLFQESDAAVPDTVCNHPLKIETLDSGDEYSLPDARTLLHVTSRRKVLHRKVSSPVENEITMDNECMEKTPEYLQNKVNMIASCNELMLIDVHDMAFEVQHSSHAFEEISHVVEDLFQSLSEISRTLLELKGFVLEDIVQFRSVASNHEKLYNAMTKKTVEQEAEKELLRKESVYLQAQIQELMLESKERENMMDEVTRQHESEKDELCRQILALKKEVSCLSSSSLMKEREVLRKELDKTKLKLKDTESKLKNAIQDKVRLEGEKAHAEREIKHLHAQQATIDRDVNKHESKIFDLNKSKVHKNSANHTLQVDYEKLERNAFKMEGEIASLEEKLIASVGEREDALTRIDVLEENIETLSHQLNSAHSELKLMEEELATMTLRLDESEVLCQRIKVDHDSILREKEDMEMQLTDALLEYEAKKSAWLTRESALLDSNKRCKDEIASLSENLAKVNGELETHQNLCKNFQKSLSSSKENAEAEKKSRSMEIAQLKSDFEILEFSRLICEVVFKTKIKELSLDQHYACEQVKKLQEQINACRGKGRSCTQTKMDIVSDGELFTARKAVEELTGKLVNMEAKAQSEMLRNNIQNTKLRMKLSSTQAKLDAFRGRYMEAIDEIEVMNKKFEAASTNLKEKLASYGLEILNLKKQLLAKD